MDKKLVRQIGFQASGLHVREVEGEKEESRVIEGYAAVFGQRSVNLVPWSGTREIYEIMEAGSIDQDLINRSDVVLTAFHDNSKIMGRSVNGEGTLELGVDEKGLWVRCELAKTRDADDMLELIKRGDITGMSFCYTADDDDSENGVSYERMEEKSADGKEVWLRHVKRCTGLYDVTIAGHPAYPQTEIANREIDEEIEKKMEAPIEDKEKREAEEMEKAAREKEEKRREEYRIKKARLRLGE